MPGAARQRFFWILKHTLNRATSRAARSVEAPGLWSMTKVPPSRSDSTWVTSRPITSDAPLGA